MTYPDEHWQEIADLVRGEMTGHGRLIADLYGVKITTAHGWIRQAREKGFLEPVEDMPCPHCGGTGKRSNGHIEANRRTARERAARRGNSNAADR